MMKYVRLLRFEMKVALRDPITLLLLFFPALLLGLSCYVLPRALRGMPGMEGFILPVLLMVAQMGGVMAGAMGAFLLFDHKDEHTLHTVASTPMGLPGYLAFKAGYMFLVCTLSVFAVLMGTKLLASDAYAVLGIPLMDRLTLTHIAGFSLVSSLGAPMLALFIGALAKNKVEGFAWVKGTGILAFIPLLALLPAFSGARQYFLGVFPNFWAAKGLAVRLLNENNPANLGYWGYMGVGMLYGLPVIFAAFRLFLKRKEY